MQAKESALVIHCAVCQTVFPPGLARCPACKSDDIRIGVETPGGTRVSAARGGTVRLRGWGEPAYKDGAQFLRHHVKLEWSPQRKRYEYVERIFNKLEGTYTERYYDPDTGQIVFQKHGPITDQSQSQGSAERVRRARRADGIGRMRFVARSSMAWPPVHARKS